MKILLCTIMLAAGTLHGQTINISNNGSPSMAPRIIAMKDILYVFWTENGSSIHAIHYKVYTNGKWSDGTRIVTAGIVTLSSVRAADSAHLDILWIDGNGLGNRLMAGRISDSILVDSVQIDSDPASVIRFSSFLFDSATAVSHCTWEARSGLAINTYYSSKTSGSEWTTKRSIITSSAEGGENHRAQLLRDKNAGIICLWFSANSIKMIRKNGDSWMDGPSLTSTVEGIGRSFTAAGDDSLNIHIVSLPAMLTTCPCNIALYAKWNGIVWSKVETVPRSQWNNGYYTESAALGICISKESYPIVSWEQRCTNVNMQLYAKLIGTAVKTNAGWHVNTDITAHQNIELPCAAVDHNNRINYVWQDSSSGNYDIFWKATSLITSIEKKTALDRPTPLLLAQNYPNPFNPSTTISFSIHSKSHVSLILYDAMGRAVGTIVSEDLPAGDYSRQWNASGVPSGVYFYRLQAGTFMETKRLLLVR